MPWLIVILVAFFYYSPFDEETHSYYVYCPGSNLINFTNECESGKRVLSSINYRANESNQTVMYKIVPSFPVKLKNCTVWDSQNWACEDNSYDFEVTLFSDDGHIDNEDLSGDFNRKREHTYISKFTYWMLKIETWFNETTS